MKIIFHNCQKVFPEFLIGIIFLCVCGLFHDLKGMLCANYDGRRRRESAKRDGPRGKNLSLSHVLLCWEMGAQARDKGGKAGGQLTTPGTSRVAGRPRKTCRKKIDSCYSKSVVTGKKNFPSQRKGGLCYLLLLFVIVARYLFAKF